MGRSESVRAAGKQEDYKTALAEAADLQRSARWEEALLHCARAIGVVKSDVLARLKTLRSAAARLGNLAGAIELAQPVAGQLPGQRALSAIVLLLMAAARSSDWPSAGTLALEIRSRVGPNPFELPRRFRSPCPSRFGSSRPSSQS